MHRPNELSHDALIDIVDALQQQLYLDCCEGRLTWNPEKERPSADALMELGILLGDHGLRPAARQPYLPTR